MRQRSLRRAARLFIDEYQYVIGILGRCSWGRIRIQLVHRLDLLQYFRR
jgi:hypothetical protein